MYLPNIFIGYFNKPFELYEVEMPVLDWSGHSNMSHNTRLKSNGFIWNHELLERCPFVK